VRFLSKENTVEENRAALIIKYRVLKKEKEEREGDIIIYYLTKGDEKCIMLVVVGQSTIGINYVRNLKKLVDEENVKKGILVGDGKYTYSAKSTAAKIGIELVPPTLPTFDIFQHDLVPEAEIVSEKEREALKEKYHAQPYQFPWIKMTDPVSIILGAEPGDVIKIKSKSETAGISESFRYVV
jgi:DNA-directed RNA polymerase subunit H (RpoH/RPB5)